MNVGERVRLISFNRSQTPDRGCADDENYWKLLGTTGLVIAGQGSSPHISPDRVLVQFDVDVIALGLQCHNETPNSLWIIASDLEAIDSL